MTREAFNRFCQAMTHTSHVVQWGNSDVWKVGGKVFAICGWGDDGKDAFTFKVSQQNYQFLEQKDGYRPAPYLASRGMSWIQQYNCTEKQDEELIYYLKESYRLVSLGLSKKKQKELGLNQEN